MKALIDGDLSTPNGIYDCSVAADALQKCVQADTHSGNQLANSKNFYLNSAILVIYTVLLDMILCPYNSNCIL